MGLQGVMKGGYQRLIPYPVQNFHSHVRHHWYDRMVQAFEFSALLTEGTSYFIIIYDATLTLPLYPEIKINSPVIILNRSFLETLIINKKAVPIPVANEPT